NGDRRWAAGGLAKAVIPSAERARARAAEIVRRARAGEDFAALARETSDDAPTRASGGRIDGRFRPDVYPAAFGAAVMKLAVGEVTDPLDYGNAWAVIQLTSRRKVTFPEVEKELAEELQTERPDGLQVNAERNVLAQKVKVEILPGMTPR